MNSVRRRSSGRHEAPAVSRTSKKVATFTPVRPGQRSPLALRQSLTVAFAFIAASAFVLVNFVSPYSTDMATAAYSSESFGGVNLQGVETTGDFTVTASGETYVSEKKKVAPAAGASINLPLVVPDPGSAQAIAHEMVLARGWSEGEFSCLVDLWAHESGWRTNAGNPVSGAYGIPQALPGHKMATAGEDWASNPATQITWGLGYIGGRYGTPCGALAAWQDKGWY